ncbi:glycine C-acetyltransferase [Sphingomonas colocasiae]|uniref:2-amino-3-ketobutyrate coenzyme A ligase n=1 Tax=Sphingomonas colocasiae TaxID=1848973 RepID=A0ABS7PT12_9SPHN|nr:glycine C-acetyltransferase [Sphingomonas colocasiae]MBY8824119.1 glycine C-acetyltransferase [Sphingomonas colocasiae]
MTGETQFIDRVREALAGIEAAGLTKPERVLLSAQGPEITVARKDGSTADAINFCANNYLGLASDPRVVAAAAEAMRSWGSGAAAARFICGTQGVHKELEAALASYLGFDDAILFAACFDANGAVFEPLFEEQDAIVSDTLNHASIIDGIRLSKAKRYRFATSDMADLERQLKAARADGARTIVIATDGVFSMDGHIANLPTITALAARYGALVMVDDCHATGHLGPEGRGTPALHGVDGRIDILTGTFGKTLGGGLGGFICAAREVIALLRQRARPYLFSNSLSPATCGAALEAIRIARSGEGDALRQQLAANRKQFREGMAAAGFDLALGETPIIPVLLGDDRAAQEMAALLLEAGIYVTGFSYPVVPKGKARIRVQLCAKHSPDQITRAIETFVTVRDTMAANGSR